MADVKTRCGIPMDEKSDDVFWPVDRIRLAGSKDVVRRAHGKETTEVPWVTAFPTYADNSPNRKSE